MNFIEFFDVFFKAAFVENLVLAYFLGMCSYLAVSKSVKTAMGLGLAVVFVLAITAPINWLLYQVLVQFNLEFLKLIIFIAVIASMVQLVEMIIEKYSPSLYNSLGIFLPLITVNCAILGGALFMIAREYTLGISVGYGIGSGVGFLIAIVALAAIRERIRYSEVPAPLRGLGMAFIITGLMGMAFMGLLGISIQDLVNN